MATVLIIVFAVIALIIYKFRNDWKENKEQYAPNGIKNDYAELVHYLMESNPNNRMTKVTQDNVRIESAIFYIDLHLVGPNLELLLMSGLFGIKENYTFPCRMSQHTMIKVIEEDMLSHLKRQGINFKYKK